MASVNDYDDVPWQEMDNPFLANMPVVSMVRSVRTINKHDVTTLDTQCQRVFARVGNHRVFPALDPSQEVLAANGAVQTLRSLDRLEPYGI
ncbi:hypothetical protein [Comamonas sp. GB3 AK4-5]|uniref:hypothetical protein n=1 Tax=Comamonas sp. GB3 AK4-5 TaxID=3231487 RepID=UPI00351E35D5